MRIPENALQFLGAAQTVTGSRYLIETGGRRILVDCGLFQGYKNLRLRNREDFPVPPDTIDFVLLTHAHLDHSGYVPGLVRDGFKGEILMTQGTSELVATLWPDSAYLLQEDADRANRKGYTKHSPAEPIYDLHDVQRALGKIRTIPFNKRIDVIPGVTAEFLTAGHILGASQIHLNVNGTTILFSGDLGRTDDPLMRSPLPYAGSDILVTESTYGDRNHPDIDPEDELAPALSKVLNRGGTVVIPAFAVGRTQSLMLHIWRLMEGKRIPRVPIYVNSPMAQSATTSYQRHQEEHRIDAAEFEDMYSYAHMVRTVDESKELNRKGGAKVIVAASGMISGGRVLHHIAEFGGDPNNAILLSGYQAGGTRGRLLQEGATSLRIHGRDVPIRAEVLTIGSMSAHADSDGLIAWMREAKTAPKMTYVTHGEPNSSDRLRFRIKDELGWPARAPLDGQIIDLDNPK